LLEHREAMPCRSTQLGALLSLIHRAAASPSTALAPYDPAAVIQPYDVAERRYRFANAGNITMRQAAASGVASSLSTVMWDAGYVLARHLDGLDGRLGGLLDRASVVELGAGLGLPSIVAALGGASKVVATDGDAQCLPLLAANAERAGASLSAHALPWEDAAAGRAVELLNGGRRFDVVLAADVVYAGNAGAWRALLNVLRALAAPGTAVLLAQTIRLGDSHAAFLRLARSRGFEVETLPAGAGGGDGDALAGKVLIYRLRVPPAAECLEDATTGSSCWASSESVY
jgi:nicotinamide N-methyltransferase